MPRFLYFMKNRELKFVSINQHLADKMELSEEAIIGKNDHDFFPKSMADAFLKDDLQIIETKQAILNKVELVPSSKGQADWALTNKVPMLDQQGEVIAIVGITRPFSSSDTALHSSKDLHAAISHMKSHFMGKLTVPELAKLSSLSVSAFERKFKKVLHSTPTQYLRILRVKHACHLLSNSSVELILIAEQAGFYDQSHFCREFTKVMNISPLQYRKQYRI